MEDTDERMNNGASNGESHPDVKAGASTRRKGFVGVIAAVLLLAMALWLVNRLKPPPAEAPYSAA